MRDLKDVVIVIPPNRQARVREIIAEEEINAGISLGRIISQSRKAKYAVPRHKAMWRARQEVLPLGYVALGKLFNRDHSTIVVAVQRVDFLLKLKLPATR